MREQSVAMGSNAESVQGMDKRGSGLSKFTPRYWHSRVFLADYRSKNGEKVVCNEFRVKIQIAGRRLNVRLQTSNRRDAAERAAQLYSRLREKGFDGTLPEFDANRKSIAHAVTVGDVITAIGNHNLKLRTAQNYSQNLYWWAARYRGLKPGKKTFGVGGSQEWRAGLNCIPISVFTAENVERIINLHIARVAGDVVKERSAKISIATFLRGARAGLKVAEKTITLPSPRPFLNAAAPKARMPTYAASFDAASLVQSARSEFRDSDPDAWLTILLAIGAGLRRGELANLRWRDIRPSSGQILVAAGGPWSGKTTDSEAPVFVDESLLKELTVFKRDPNEHVLAPGRTAKGERCAYLFGRVTTWLRDHGVAGDKPLHALRKEFGSIVAQNSDLFTASKQLRHTSLSVTAMHYVENRKRVAPKLDVLMGNYQSST